MKLPTSARKSNRYLQALGICILFGAMIVTAVEIPDVPRGLRDAGLVLGGVLIGLLSLVIDEKLRAEPEMI